MLPLTSKPTRLWLLTCSDKPRRKNMLASLPNEILNQIFQVSWLHFGLMKLMRDMASETHRHCILSRLQ